VQWVAWEHNRIAVWATFVSAFSNIADYSRGQFQVELWVVVDLLKDAAAENQVAIKAENGEAEEGSEESREKEEGGCRKDFQMPILQSRGCRVLSLRYEVNDG
jgi:hypothetical protein